MNVQTKIIRGIKYLAILLVSFIAFILIINMSIFDETLKPEVEAMLETQQITIERDNAYIAIWGITADNDKNFMDAGLALMERHKKITDTTEHSVLSDLDIKEVLGERNLDRSWLDQYKNCRARTRNGCLKETSEYLAINPLTDTRLLLMLDRYSKIVKLKKYQLIMEVHFDSLLPSYSEIMRLGQIRISNTYLKRNTMNTLSIIEEELVFWRMMLSQSGDLYNKMISVASLWRNYSTLSEIISTEQLAPQEEEKLQSMVSNITKEELDMSKVFHSETKAVILALKDAVSGGATKEQFDLSNEFTIPLWQKNATLNHLYFKNHLPIICLSKLDVQDFYKFREEKKEYCEFPSEQDIQFYNLSLYNPMGKVLSSVGQPGYTNYIARVHDLNGVISLVKLQLELKSVADGNIEEAIKKSLLRNLYTGEPMNYDKEKNEISFNCLDKGSVCKLSL